MNRSVIDIGPHLASKTEPTEAETAYAKSLIGFREIYDAVGQTKAHDATNVDAGDLSRMFGPSSKSAARKPWLLSTVQMLPLGSREQRRRALEPIVAFAGFELAEPQPMTKDEYIAKLEATIVACGRLAEDMRDRMLGRVPESTELAAAKQRIAQLEETIHAFQLSYIAGGRP